MSLTYVKVGALDLRKHAHLVQTQSGRWQAPAIEGSNLKVPGVAGEKWLPKVLGGRLFPLSLVVLPADASDAIVPDGMEAQFHANLKALGDAMVTPGTLLDLEVGVAEGAGTTTLYGQGEYVGGLDPRMTTPVRAIMVVDLWMPDPYWYTNALRTTGARLW